MSAGLPEGAVPRLPRGVRLKNDRARERWVLLGPERIIDCSPSAVEILKRVDGASTVEAIIDDLSSCFAADRGTISRDVRRLLEDLMTKQLVLI